MEAAQTQVQDVRRDEVARMKEALRRLAASAGEEVVGEVETFIDGLEETIAAKEDRIEELEAEKEDMVPLDTVKMEQRDNEDLVRGLARTHRMLKMGDAASGLSELEYVLDRHCDKWRMYVS